MAGGFPALTGNELIKALTKKCGCKEGGKRTHGMAVTRNSNGRTYVTVIPTKDDSLPNGTLGAILRQLNLTRDEIKKLL